MRNSDPRGGFTLVELMIAISLGLVIIYASFACFRAATGMFQACNRLAVGNAMLRACMYYGFESADGVINVAPAIASDDFPSSFPANWPIPVVSAKWRPIELNRSLATTSPEGARGLFFGPINNGNDGEPAGMSTVWKGGSWEYQGNPSWSAQPMWWLLTPYGRDDPWAPLTSVFVTNWYTNSSSMNQAAYPVVYLNDGSGGWAGHHAGRRLTTRRTRMCAIALTDAIVGKSRAYAFSLTGATHQAATTTSAGWTAIGADP